MPRQLKNKQQKRWEIKMKWYYRGYNSSPKWRLTYFADAAIFMTPHYTFIIPFPRFITRYNIHKQWSKKK